MSTKNSSYNELVIQYSFRINLQKNYSVKSYNNRKHYLIVETNFNDKNPSTKKELYLFPAAEARTPSKFMLLKLSPIFDF
jgi:hypothetical protein